MSQRKPPQIFFSVGEPSGDLHGANLIRQLQRQCPGLKAVGYGGPKMAEAGCELHEDLTALAVMWFARALMNLHKFWALVRRADRYFAERRPDAVVLVDYPGFNWWIARRAKARGIPVFYYCPPQIWAWARWRVKKMRRFVDHVLCSLPFEEPWFRRHGCNATFVGHPFFDEVRRHAYDEAFIMEHAGGKGDSPHSPEPSDGCFTERATVPFSGRGPLVAILPGSRTQEVTNNLRYFLKAAAIVRREVPGVRFAIASFKPQQAEIARRAVEKSDLPIEVYVGKTPELMRLADCAMSVSGSVSLELLYHTTPTVILYWITRFAYFVQGFFRKVKYITLVNLLATGGIEEEEVSGQWSVASGQDSVVSGQWPVASGEKAEGERGRQGLGTSAPRDEPSDARVLFPEYLTCEDKSAEIAEHIVGWLTDPASRAARVGALEELKAKIAHGGASGRAAEYILEALNAGGPVAAPHSTAKQHASAAESRDRG